MLVFKEIAYIKESSQIATICNSMYIIDFDVTFTVCCSQKNRGKFQEARCKTINL